MSDFAIQLSVDSTPGFAPGEVVELVGNATIEFFEHFSPSFGGNKVQLNYMDGIAHHESVAGFGDFQHLSPACVSDSGVFESNLSLASVDPGLLANLQSADVMDPMNSEFTFQSFNSELLNSMPQLQSALNGGLGYEELSRLIVDIQAQVLELNSISQNLYGDLSAEVSEACDSIAGEETSALLGFMQDDSAVFAVSEMPLGSSLAFEATLDGLFTSPEAFPLTLDFSNPHGIQEASELFASAGGVSSISSSATSTESETGAFGTHTGSTDLS